MTIKKFGAMSAPLGLFAFTAVVANAAAVNTSYLTSILTSLSALLTTLLPILIGLAVIFFLWGLVKFMFNAGDEAAKDEGKRIMIWGVVILFVMISVWGLVAILTELTGVTAGGTATAVPTLP